MTRKPDDVLNGKTRSESIVGEWSQVFIGNVEGDTRECIGLEILTELLKMPVRVHFYSREEVNDLVETLESARDTLWSGQ